MESTDYNGNPPELPDVGNYAAEYSLGGMHMKPRLALLLLLIVGSGAALAHSQSAEFSLAISLPKTDVTVGEPIPLTIVMTNNSNRNMEWGRSPNEKRPAFLIKVLNQQNQLVAQTDYGKEMSGTPKRRGPIFGSYWADILAPGNSVSAKVMLNKEYEINAKGTYRIRVERMVDNGVHLTSNELVLNIR